MVRVLFLSARLGSLDIPRLDKLAAAAIGKFWLLHTHGTRTTRQAQCGSCATESPLSIRLTRLRIGKQAPTYSATCRQTVCLSSNTPADWTPSRLFKYKYPWVSPSSIDRCTSDPNAYQDKTDALLNAEREASKYEGCHKYA